MKESSMFGHAAVVAPHYLASEAGRAVLIEGGNAIEAMVAMAGAVAVAYPHMNAIGGDGFWVIRTPDGKVRAIEACGFAGAKATISRYREKGYDAIPVRGADAAVTVAGAIGGWMKALELSKALIRAAQRTHLDALHLQLDKHGVGQVLDADLFDQLVDRGRENNLAVASGRTTPFGRQ